MEKTRDYLYKILEEHNIKSSIVLEASEKLDPYVTAAQKEMNKKLVDKNVC